MYIVSNADTDRLVAADAVAVSTSGGKDSILAMVQVMEQIDALGIDRSKVVAIHADMGRAEHPATDENLESEGFFTGTPGELAEAQAKHFGIRFEVVSRPQGDLIQVWADKKQNSRVGATNCQGTSDLKRGQIFKVYTKIAREWKAANPTERRPCRIVEVWGLAGHESGAREKRLAAYERDARGWAWSYNAKASTQTTRTVWTVCPLADVESDKVVFAACRKIQAETGCPTLHWVYKYLPRLSCNFCVFMSRDLLAQSARIAPENMSLLESLVEDEKDWVRPWASKFTLADVLETARSGKDLSDLDWGNQA